MNYTLLSTRPSSYFLFALKEKVFIKDTGSIGKIIMTNNCIDPVWEFEIEEKAGDCIHDNDNCIIFYQKSKSTFININNGKIEQTENRYYYLKKDGRIVYIDMQDTDKIVIANEHHSKIPHLQSTKWFYGRYLIQKIWDTNTISCTDLDSGNELWKVSFDRLDPDKGRMNVLSMSFHKDTIYFFAGGTETDATFCMHLQTGDIIQQYPDLRGYNSIEGDTLYNLFFNQLNTLHIPTGTRKTCDFKQIFKSNNIEQADYSSWLVNAGMIYFTESTGVDMHSGTQGAKLFIMEITTGEIKWQYTLPVRCGLVGSMHLVKNRLYIHTQDRSLFIFEK